MRLLPIFFIIPLLWEGLGLSLGHKFALYIYLGLPAILFIYSLISKKKLHFPFLATILFFLFLFFSLISTFFFSLDKQISFEFLLFYTASFLIFVFITNFEEKGKTIFFKMIILGSIVFTLFHLFTYLPVYQNLPAIHPTNEYQYVTPYYGKNNHLGDYIGLIIIILIFYFFKFSKKIFLLPIISLLPIFIASFSRSAYIGILIILTLLIFIKKRLVSFIIIIPILAITLYFFIGITKPFKTIRTTPVFKVFSNPFIFPEKNLFEGRIKYFKQSINSFIDEPLFGVGPGNFSYASSKYLDHPDSWTDTAHNIFLEILIENGLLSFIFFCLFIILVLRHGLKNISIFFFLFIYLLFIFQTNYTYRIYSFFIMFMMLGGLIYKEKKKLHHPFAYAVTSFFLLLSIFTMLLSHIFYKSGSLSLSSFIYPLNKEVYPALIKKEQVNNPVKALKISEKYEWVAPQNIITLVYLGEFYEKQKDKKKALKYYEKTYLANPYVQFSIIKKIYSLKKEVISKRMAHIFLQDVLEYYKNLPFIPEEFKKDVESFCLKEEEKQLCIKYNWISN